MSGGSEPCLAAWHGRVAQWPLRQLGLGVKVCGGHCYPPLTGERMSGCTPMTTLGRWSMGDSGLEDQDKSAHRGSFPKLSMRDRIATWWKGRKYKSKRFPRALNYKWWFRCLHHTHILWVLKLLLRTWYAFWKRQRATGWSTFVFKQTLSCTSTVTLAES